MIIAVLKKSLAEAELRRLVRRLNNTLPFYKTWSTCVLRSDGVSVYRAIAAFLAVRLFGKKHYRRQGTKNANNGIGNGGHISHIDRGRIN